MFRTLKNADWFADGFPIAVEWRRPQTPFPRHKHEFSELVIVTGGKGLHRVGGASWGLGAGDVFVISGALAHEYSDLEELRLVNILFQPDNLKLQTADLAQLPGYHALFGLEAGWRNRHQFKNRLHLPPRQLDRLLALVESLDDELKSRAPGFGFLATALFMQIIGYLSRCDGHLNQADSRNSPRIAATLSFLESNPAKPVNLLQLAAVAGMSRRNFIRAFRDATGSTPMAYWNQLRINRAAALLRAGTEPITEIAFRAGFADSNYFARQFRKMLGVSPRHYRQQHGAPPPNAPRAAPVPQVIRSFSQHSRGAGIG